MEKKRNLFKTLLKLICKMITALYKFKFGSKTSKKNVSNQFLLMSARLIILVCIS